LLSAGGRTLRHLCPTRPSSSHRLSRAGIAAVAAALGILLAGAAAEPSSDPAAKLTGLLTDQGPLRVQPDPDGPIVWVEEPAGVRIGLVRCETHPASFFVPRVRTPGCYLAIKTFVDSRVFRRLLSVAHRIEAVNDGTLGLANESPSPPVMPRELAVAAALAAVVAATLALLFRVPVTSTLRVSHLLPATLQVLILVYWQTYYPAVRSRMPSIALQIVLAYALDATFSIIRTRSWRVGVGPLPIILSANLFGWFQDPGAIVLVVVAIASRSWFRRGDRHIFNPSALGISVAGLLGMLVFPSSMMLGSVLFPLAVPPNMSELIILLAIIPALRFRIALISIGAASALLISKLAWSASPDLSYPSMLLAFSLFATDPATVPETPVGQLLFGLFVGSGVAATSGLLWTFGAPDEISKVLPIPVANALTPVFDRLGRASPPLSGLAPRWNIAHVFVWLTIASATLWQEKAKHFQAALHWTYGTPLVVRGPDDVPDCDLNPTFCRPFTVPQEVVLWISRFRRARAGETGPS
jgi:hypothetical protein